MGISMGGVGWGVCKIGGPKPPYHFWAWLSHFRLLIKRVSFQKLPGLSFGLFNPFLLTVRREGFIQRMGSVENSGCGYHSGISRLVFGLLYAFIILRCRLLSREKKIGLEG